MYFFAQIDLPPFGKGEKNPQIRRGPKKCGGPPQDLPRGYFTALCIHLHQVLPWYLIGTVLRLRSKLRLTYRLPIHRCRSYIHRQIEFCKSRGPYPHVKKEELEWGMEKHTYRTEDSEAAQSLIQLRGESHRILRLFELAYEQ